MARRKNTDGADFDFAAVEVADSTQMPARAARDEKPNPLLGAVSDTLLSGTPKVLPRIPDDKVKDATNYLRRASVKLDCGIEIRTERNGDGTTAVHFQAKAEKRNRNYTVEDVRAWADEQGYTDAELWPRVQKHVSNAYREAHGFKVATASE